MEERIQKILSQWGVASRRQAEEMIRLGRVRCNGKVIELGQKADPQVDEITVDGKLIQLRSRPQPVYLLLNKPAGVISTRHDPQGRRTVMDLLPLELRVGQGIHPVGRLDADSTGALLLTNDGNLTLALTHPRHNIKKTYRVWVEGHPPLFVLQQWRRGVELDGRKTRPARVRILAQNATHTCLEVILQEGRNRQIRRIAQQLGHPVHQLQRTAIGLIQLQPPPLSEGCYRPLQDFELRFLRDQIDRMRIQESSAIQE
ncbi:pseudouridine synthase [Chroococcidiopsis sp. TS-821]|uniref:pseudouridine synthase n=1 Tax=Chroococcidiopsis sp. TS-821 TaxID=1378066 RepID=UPI000CEDF385|nr:pseudouridine synthase [Chroococcidiopsis sp. TS-821]PPS41184.1 pseudouridine synthase [Chroococcidiopsis sp. TS-821]